MVLLRLRLPTSGVGNDQDRPLGAAAGRAALQLTRRRQGELRFSPRRRGRLRVGAVRGTSKTGEDGGNPCSPEVTDGIMYRSHVRRKGCKFVRNHLWGYVCSEGRMREISGSSAGSGLDSGFRTAMLEKEDHGRAVSVECTPDIEKKYVHHVYDAIAPHFSSTRFAKWPKVASFINSLKPRSLVLDAGCGNGKYLGFNPDCFYIGCDISAPLIDICAGRGHEVVVADAVNLPYRSGFSDAAISIAVLHHLSTESRRRKAIRELVRVVRKGGHVLITVWAVEQEDKSLLTKWTPLNLKYEEEWVSPSSPRVRSPSTITLESIPEASENGSNDVKQAQAAQLEMKRKNDGQKLNGTEGVPTADLSQKDKHLGSPSSNETDRQEYFVPWHLPYHRAEVSGASASAIASGFAKKDDKKGAVVYNRYYHVFKEGELERLVSGVQDAVITEQFYDKSNWCVILEKTQGTAAL